MKGFSMVETVVGIAIVSILILILSSFSVSAFENMTAMDRNSAIYDSFEEVRLALSKGDACSKNFGARGVKFNSPITTGVSYLNLQTGILHTKPFLQLNQNSNGIRVSDMRIIEGSRIEDTHFLGELSLTFQTQTSKPVEVKRTLPLQVSVQNGIIQECWIRQDSASIAQNQICYELTNGVLNAVDPSTGECMLAGGKWFTGTAEQASCPAGTFLPSEATSSGNCDIDYPSGFHDPFEQTDVPLSDGSVTSINWQPTRLRLNKNQKKCTCDWAADLDPSSYSGAKCKILCIQP